jgi:hypothetical protein
VKLICTWPVEVSDGVPKFWLVPLFGHSIAWPPEAAASFTTAKGENRLWPERLSSSTTRVLLPVPLDEDEELLLDDELELEELLEDELLEEVLELPPLLEEEELLLEDEELELELELEELPLEVPSPVQVGAIKLPS